MKLKSIIIIALLLIAAIVCISSVAQAEMDPNGAAQLNVAHKTIIPGMGTGITWTCTGMRGPVTIFLNVYNEDMTKMVGIIKTYSNLYPYPLTEGSVSGRLYWNGLDGMLSPLPNGNYYIEMVVTNGWTSNRCPSVDVPITINNAFTMGNGKANHYAYGRVILRD